MKITLFNNLAPIIPVLLSKATDSSVELCQVYSALLGALHRFPIISLKKGFGVLMLLTDHLPVIFKVASQQPVVDGINFVDPILLSSAISEELNEFTEEG